MSNINILFFLFLCLRTITIAILAVAIVIMLDIFLQRPRKYDSSITYQFITSLSRTIVVKDFHLPIIFLVASLLTLLILTTNEGTRQELNKLVDELSQASLPAELPKAELSPNLQATDTLEAPILPIFTSTDTPIPVFTLTPSRTPTDTPLLPTLTFTSRPASTATFTPLPSNTFTPDPTYTPTFTAESKEGLSASDGMVQLLVDNFWIDRTEVTNAMYALCVNAGACKPPGEPTPPNMTIYFGVSSYNHFPAVRTDYFSAVNYCRWAGRRLPTASEWQKAAGSDYGNIYPWGSSAPECTYANFDNGGFCVGGGGIDAVGIRPDGSSPYGVLDMAGNASEWVLDSCGNNQHYLFGGSWNDSAEKMRINDPWCRDDNSVSTKIGFRCVDD